MLRDQVGISNDLASLLYSRSLAEIITSQTPLAEIITSRTLVSSLDAMTMTLALSMQQCNVIFYERLKNSYLYSKAAKSYFDEPREKIVVKAALRPRQDNLEVFKGFRSQGVHNILCATREFVIIK
jgi:hypothetical protein